MQKLHVKLGTHHEISPWMGCHVPMSLDSRFSWTYGSKVSSPINGLIPLRTCYFHVEIKRMSWHSSWLTI